MKRIDRVIRFVNFGLLIIMATGMGGCSRYNVSIKAYPPEKIIPMAQLKIYDGAKRLSSFVFYFDEGETIPLALSMESDFITFK